MTALAWAFLVAAAALAVGDWVAVARGNRRLEYGCKPGTLALLIGVALALDPTHGDVRAWFVAALVLSLAGDVFLMLPEDRFVPGLAAFLLGHVAYVIGLNLHGGSAGELGLAAIPVALAAAVLAVRILRAVVAGGRRELIGPLVAYMLVISAMVASAVASGNVVAAGGAALFFASDALIAETRFVRPHRGARVVIMVTYHLGQAGLVLSLLD
ncbi:MAG TPA: lysoplasmalogenase [Acidimicrobiia bacterium]|nr:lysoplasmalogenase [Acidimicrobiia bacterium]